MTVDATINTVQSVAVKQSRLMKLSLVLEAWILLLRVDLIMKFRSPEFLRTRVKRQPVCIRGGFTAGTIENLAHAMDIACVFYFRRVLCLQCSSATTIHMRKHGWPARLVTGARTVLCDFHAWTEVEGIVVNDKPYMREIYRVWEVY